MDDASLNKQANEEDDIRVEENEVQRATIEIIYDGDEDIRDKGDDDQQMEEVNVEGEKEDVEGEKNVEEGNARDGDGDEDKGHFERKKRKKFSKAYDDFVVVTLHDGTKKFQCLHCKTLLIMSPTGTTSHLWNHLKRCFQKKFHTGKQKTLQFQPAKAKLEMKSLLDGRYDHVKQREAIAHWILMSEQPFNVVENDGFIFMMSINQPTFEKISRAMAKRDVINVYEIEKKKLQLALKDISKISLTTDIWKSKVQKISYMCVTGHYVDQEWQLQKRLLSFIPFPPPHASVDIYDGLIKCTKDWGIEHKVFTISVDNATNNDAAIRIAKQTFSRSRKLPLEGQLFHVRCTAHILNLVVQDGISEIKSIIEDVKNSVRFINQSETRLRKFSDVVHRLGIPVKRLIIDCQTRWNSTYEMLVEAFRVKDAFPIYQQIDPLYHCCPSIDDWKKVKDVVDILEVFYEATHVISGVDYPTSNVYLAVIWRVKHILNEKENHGDEFIREMIKKMKQKFDKYWGSCNLLMAIGAILDPRYKMRLVEFAFSKIYSESDARTKVMNVRVSLHSLFFEYVEVDNARTRKGTNTETYSATRANSTSNAKLVPSGMSMFDDYLNTVEVDGPSKSELDIYLEEGVFRSQDGDASVATEFDALAWWKSQELKFKVLSKVARDVLAIPISTVASEATFSAGTQVLDPYRSRLSSDVVQALICGADWVRRLHGIKKPIMTHEEEEPFYVMLQTT